MAAGAKYQPVFWALTVKNEIWGLKGQYLQHILAGAGPGHGLVLAGAGPGCGLVLAAAGPGRGLCCPSCGAFLVFLPLTAVLWVLLRMAWTWLAVLYNMVKDKCAEGVNTSIPLTCVKLKCDRNVRIRHTAPATPRKGSILTARTTSGFLAPEASIQE